MNQESAQTPSLGFNGVSPSPAPAAIPVDELAFGLLINRALGGSDSRRPSDKSANEIQVDMVLGQAQNLAKMNDQYVETYVVRGTKELYALLGAIYSYALQINESPLRDHILQRMRERLEEEHEIKTQINTPWLTTVLRFILPTDRQTAYSKTWLQPNYLPTSRSAVASARSRLPKRKRNLSKASKSTRKPKRRC